MFITTGNAVIGGALPTITYAGFSYQTGNANNYTLTSVPIGTPHPRRSLIIITASNFLASATASTVMLTVDAVAATSVYAITALGLSFWMIPWPTGTTATVFYQSDNGDKYFFGAVHVWACYNLRNTTSAVQASATFSGLGNFSVTQSITTQNKGCIALFGNDVAGGTTGPFTWTNATEDADASGYGSGTGQPSPYTAAHVEQTPGTSRSVTMSTGDECTMFWCSVR